MVLFGYKKRERFETFDVSVCLKLNFLSFKVPKSKANYKTNALNEELRN